MSALVETNLTVPAIATGLDAIHDSLSRFWQALDAEVSRPGGDQWQHDFTIAVAEIAANIVRHAYAGMQEPGDMHLRLCAYADRAEAWFVDHGMAGTFPPPAEAPPEGDWQDIPESGRGLAIARACLDELEYRRNTAHRTNEWHLEKRFPA